MTAGICEDVKWPHMFAEFTGMVQPIGPLLSVFMRQNPRSYLLMVLQAPLKVGLTKWAWEIPVYDVNIFTKIEKDVDSIAQY
jgi:hypothetical protein